jgi:hypothetical protein
MAGVHFGNVLILPLRIIACCPPTCKPASIADIFPIATESWTPWCSTRPFGPAGVILEVMAISKTDTMRPER